MRRPSDHSDFEKRGEFSDPELLERELSRNPDATLRRREFLARTAALAGGAALAGALPAEQPGRRGGAAHDAPQAAEPREHADRHRSSC